MGSVFYEDAGRASFFYEDRDISFPGHIHRQIEVFYLLDGQVDLMLGREHLRIEKGEIAVIFPNVIHSYESIGNSRFYIGLVEPDKIGNNQVYYQQYHCMNPINNISDFHPELFHIMEVMAAQNTKNGVSMKEERLNGYLIVFMDYLLECLELERTLQTDEKDILSKVLSYTLNHASENLSLDLVAHELGISKYYLSKLFSGKIDCSFPEYLIQIRVEHAKELLHRTDKKMEEIACICGFQSETSFFRNFKKIVGITPLKYRKQLFLEDKNDIYSFLGN